MTLFLAAVLSLQDKSAAEILQKIEETITSAKTLSVKLKISRTDGAEEKTTLSGTLLLKGEKKVFVSLDADVGGQKDKLLVVSDGEVLESRSESVNLPLSFPAQARHRDLFAYAFARGGGAGVAAMASIFCGHVHAARKMEPDAKKVVAVTDVQKGPDGSSLTFSSKMDHFGPLLKITLWYDQVTFKPLKSTITGGRGGALSEVYEELTLNGEIPDEKFTLPEKK